MTAIPKVSVLMAVYNTNPQHLREAVDSILGQTFTDFELVIVNDASTSADVEDVIRGYTDERIRYYVNEKNLGISPTRNRLMDLARGEYIAVMDHDDISLPERLAEEVAYLDEHADIGVVSCFLENFGEETSRNGFPVFDADIRCVLTDYCAVIHSAAMLRKSVLFENGIRYEEQFSPAEDYALWCRLISVTKFYNFSKPLLRYRLHVGNTSKVKSEHMKRATQAIHRLVRAEHPDLYQQFLESAIQITRVKIFGILPLYKMVVVCGRTTLYLFNKIPIYSLKKQITVLKSNWLT